MMTKNAILVSAVLSLAVGCYEGADDLGAVDRSAEVQEIIDNLVAADYPESEITVLDDGRVMVGNDAEVGLAASREIAGSRRVESELADDITVRQFSTNNLVGSSHDTICINGSAYTGTLSTALDNAIAKYNGQNLSFQMVRTSGSTSGCDAVITAKKVSGTGGYAGFPSGGKPYNTINIGTGNASYGVAVTTHVITHELGHCVGFRHSDYYNRSISCGGAAENEGSAGIGANLIPGTPQSATVNGSVMNSCFNQNSTGNWTTSDVTALQTLYGGGGGGDEGGDDGPQPGPTSCYNACGANAGQCWCDASCAQYGDCCADKAEHCG